MKFTVFLMMAVLLSGCMSDSASSGFARGISGVSEREPPRRTRETPDLLGDYYERQARRADQETLRQSRNARMCRTMPDSIYC